jgi:hypothetical protein
MLKELYNAYLKDKFQSFDELMNRRNLQIEVKEINQQEYTKRLSECMISINSDTGNEESGNIDQEIKYEQRFTSLFQNR